jgi:hypothetical protein
MGSPSMILDTSPLYEFIFLHKNNITVEQTAAAARMSRKKRGIGRLGGATNERRDTIVIGEEESAWIALK